MEARVYTLYMVRDLMVKTKYYIVQQLRGTGSFVDEVLLLAEDLTCTCAECLHALSTLTVPVCPN